MLTSLRQRLTATRSRTTLVTLAVLSGLFVLPRILHLGPVLDDPHSWVQADREYSVWAYYRYGITLLDMNVCYFGGFRSCLLEFPLPDVIPAVFYRVFGPHILICRLVTLAFYAGAVVYLYKTAERLFDRVFAVLATGIYLVLPMGIFFSRAVLLHDWAAVFMAHATVYYYLRGFDEDRVRLIVVGTACATLALLIKPPYVFYFALPLGYHFVATREWRRILRFLPAFAFPAAPFLAWRHHFDAVNSRHPDWSFIPGYLDMNHMNFWYYGPFEMRLHLDNWLTIASRVNAEIFATWGFVLFALGLWSIRKHRSFVFVVLWAAGVLLGILIFFNLNLVHDYYQNPVLAVAALGIAAFFRNLLPWPFERSSRRTEAAVALLALFVCGSLVTAEMRFYGVDILNVRIADALVRTTSEDDLVVCTALYGTSPQDTRILGRAHRAGWPLRRMDITTDMLDRLRHEGATTLAWVGPKDVFDLPPDVRAYVGDAAISTEVIDVDVALYTVPLNRARPLPGPSGPAGAAPPESR